MCIVLIINSTFIGIFLRYKEITIFESNFSKKKLINLITDSTSTLLVSSSQKILVVSTLPSDL